MYSYIYSSKYIIFAAVFPFSMMFKLDFLSCAASEFAGPRMNLRFFSHFFLMDLENNGVAAKSWSRDFT